jgi:FtsZ-interacting cell division protein ZipA
MQTDLRLILLTVGLCIVAVIFFDGIKRRKNSEAQKSKSIESHLNQEEWSDNHNLTACVLTQKNSFVNQMIAVQIMANNPMGFSGKALLAMITMHHLQHNARQLYDCYAPDKTQILYSMASIIEPGTFDRHRLAQKNYPGIMLFMILDEHQADTASIAFETMLKAAQDMAQALDAGLYDLHNQPLSQEHIEQFRLAVQNRTVA